MKLTNCRRKKNTIEKWASFFIEHPVAPSTICSAASSVSKHILNLQPMEKEWLCSRKTHLALNEHKWKDKVYPELSLRPARLPHQGHWN